MANEIRGFTSGSKTVMDTQAVTIKVSGFSSSDILRIMKQNMHKANRKAKKMAAEKVKKRVKDGIEGATYNSQYARLKSKVKPKNYSRSGPVDLNFSNQLMRNLVGRGRARPAKGQLTIWLGFDKQSRREHMKGGDDLTNEQLARIINGEKDPRQAKIGRSGEPPISIHQDERAEVLQETIRQIVKDTKAQGNT